jgi:TM2 domain-containing membrane protein YozV
MDTKDTNGSQHAARPSDLTRMYRADAQSALDARPRRSRGVYVILGLLLGLLGIHNFYASRFLSGAVQLLVTLTLGWLLIAPLFVVGLWVLVELFVVNTDGRGVAMD